MKKSSITGIIMGIALLCSAIAFAGNSSSNSSNNDSDNESIECCCGKTCGCEGECPCGNGDCTECYYCRNHKGCNACYDCDHKGYCCDYDNERPRRHHRHEGCCRPCR